MPTPSGRILVDWIDGFMRYTENSEPPRLFRKWTAISCIASALQRKVQLDWATSMIFYPNLYIVLVGPSATGKGTAMNPGLSIISQVPAIRLAANATSLQALIRRLKDTNLTDIDKRTGEQSFHSSLTVFSKEFTVFLGYHNRELMAALCDWYDCDRKWIYETISRKTEEINGVWVNLIAGTTPDLIRSSLPIESIGGGLTSRIIFIYEEKPDKLVTIPTETSQERELQIALTQDLESISLLSGKFQWTEKFIDTWDDWCRKAQVNPPFRDKKFDGYNGRRRVHLLKLSMIHAVSDASNKYLVMTEDHLLKAIETLTEAEEKMEMTFKGVGKSDIADLMHQTSLFIVSSPMDEIPLYHIYKSFEADADKMTMDRVLQSLEASKLLKIINKPGSDAYIKKISINSLKNLMNS